MDRVDLEFTPTSCSCCIALRNLGDSIQGGQAKSVANKNYISLFETRGRGESPSILCAPGAALASGGRIHPDFSAHGSGKLRNKTIYSKFETRTRMRSHCADGIEWARRRLSLKKYIRTALRYAGSAETSHRVYFSQNCRVCSVGSGLGFELQITSQPMQIFRVNAEQSCGVRITPRCLPKSALD